MENVETKKPEEQVIITYNDTEYRAADLNEEQMAIAAKLNVAGRKLARLQESYDDYVITNEYKNLCIESFDRAINAVEEEAEVVEES
nr:hypothetical protein [uncultured Mediterranean phage uvMED]